VCYRDLICFLYPNPDKPEVQGQEKGVSRKAAKNAKEILRPGLKPTIWHFFASLASLRENFLLF
jgi:hypothetical protein